MFRASKSLSMFMGDQVNDFLAKKRKALQSTIEHIKAEDFLELDEMDLINDLVDKFKVDAPVIDFENISVSNYEKQIPAEHFPQGIYVRQGKSYLKQVVVSHLPFTGNDELFRFTPSHFMLWSTEVYIEDKNVCFEFVNFGGDIEEIKREARRSIDAIKFFSNALLQDVGSYDAQLRGNVDFFFSSRRRHTIFKCDWSSDVCSSDLALHSSAGTPKPSPECSATPRVWPASVSCGLPPLVSTSTRENPLLVNS